MSTEKKEAPEVTQYEAMMAIVHLRSFAAYIEGRFTMRKKPRKAIKWSLETLTKFIAEHTEP